VHCVGHNARVAGTNNQHTYCPILLLLLDPTQVPFKMVTPAHSHTFNVPSAASHSLTHSFIRPGDAQTWSLDDWSWNPYDLETQPRAQADPSLTPAAKRHKADGTAAAAAAAAAAAMSAAPNCCSTPTPAAAAAAAAAAQQHAASLAHPFGSFQGLLAGNDMAAAAQFAWAQQMQQAQLMQQQHGSNAAAAGSCIGSNGAGPAPLRHCQALANGLPFLAQPNAAAAAGQFCCPPGPMAAAAACGSMAATAAPPQSTAAAAAALSVASLQSPSGHQLLGLDLSALPMQQAAAAAAAAVGGGAGGDITSVAESGSASDSGLHMHAATSAAAAAAAAAAAMNPLLLPNAAAAMAAPPAAAETPSTVGPSSALPPPGFAADLIAAAAADSAAAAAAAAEGGAAVMLGEAGEGEGDQKLVCQVPGCGKDLSHLKDYHQRYRICDTHIKLPQVGERGGCCASVCVCVGGVFCDECTTGCVS